MTIDEGLEIQQEQLADMDIYIKPEVMTVLRFYVSIKNRELRRDQNGFDVFRGNDMFEWVRMNVELLSDMQRGVL